jgi:hypothetical protein
LCSFLQPPVTSSLFGPNILFSNLFSITLSLCSSLKVRENVWYHARINLISSGMFTKRF